MTQPAYIAVDLGAESGRVIVGSINDGRLSMHEAHRFRHLPVPTPSGLCWDLTGLWHNILEGLRKAAAHAASANLKPISVGVDTWGVDWTLVSPNGVLLGLPRCYRDPAFDATFQSVQQKIGSDRIYHATGIQHMPLNTLYQYAHRFEQEPAAFTPDTQLLFMPDLFHWLLSGERTTERTIASTSQMLNPQTGGWSDDLLTELGLPTNPLGTLVDPGHTIGQIKAEVAQTTGLDRSVLVTAPPSHDTAAAVAATPAQPGTDWCYLSSGTWSLLGAELAEPCITDASAAANFTNERGIAGTTRFLKNITGLWLVQEVRRQLENEGKPMGYAELTEQAAGAEPLRTLIPVSDPVFARPGQMIDRLRAYAKQTNQPDPQTVGQLVRCCLESLAIEYRQTLIEMESILDRRFDVLHIVGGGGQNGLLNRMTAHATGRRICVGPYEATAIGNLLTQAMGLGEIDSLEALRQISTTCEEIQTIAPEPSQQWDEAAANYPQLEPAERAC